MMLLGTIEVTTLMALALFACFAWGFIEHRRPFTRKGKQRKALIDAMGRNDLDEVSRILKQGLNPNFKTYELSPIGFAFRSNRRAVVDVLLANGASLSPKSPGNANLIIEAARSCNADLVDLALAAGHRLDFRREGSGTSALGMAVRKNSPEMIRHLFAKGATKDDLSAVRWHTIRSPTVLTLLELGVPVPDDVATPVKEGKWD